MDKVHKFKFGDIFYIKAFIKWDYELGQIMRFDEEKGMYVVIRFLDNLDPHRFWCWCYIKEDEIEFASTIFDDDSYHNDLFPEDTNLTEKEYLELYDEDYDLYLKLMKHEITDEEFSKGYQKLHNLK